MGGTVNLVAPQPRSRCTTGSERLSNSSGRLPHGPLAAHRPPGAPSSGLNTLATEFLQVGDACASPRASRACQHCRRCRRRCLPRRRVGGSGPHSLPGRRTPQCGTLPGTACRRQTRCTWLLAWRMACHAWWRSAGLRALMSRTARTAGRPCTAARRRVTCSACGSCWLLVLEWQHPPITAKRHCNLRWQVGTVTQP